MGLKYMFFNLFVLINLFSFTISAMSQIKQSSMLSFVISQSSHINKSGNQPVIDKKTEIEVLMKKNNVDKTKTNAGKSSQMHQLSTPQRNLKSSMSDKNKVNNLRSVQNSDVGKKLILL